jgi:hypothetical protein
MAVLFAGIFLVPMAVLAGSQHTQGLDWFAAIVFDLVITVLITPVTFAIVSAWEVAVGIDQAVQDERRILRDGAGAYGFHRGTLMEPTPLEGRLSHDARGEIAPPET